DTRKEGREDARKDIRTDRHFHDRRKLSVSEEHESLDSRPDFDENDVWSVKRFTSARNALKFYRVMAFITGTMLLILTVEMIYKYLIAADPATALNFGGFNLAAAIAICHGWCYV